MMARFEAFTPLTSPKRETYTGRTDFWIAKFWKFVFLRNVHAMHLFWKIKGIKAVPIKLIPCFEQTLFQTTSEKPSSTEQMS